MKTTKPTYHRLLVTADPKMAIWLIDDRWHMVQRGTGTLDTSVLRGRYFIELEHCGPSGVAYPIELFTDLEVTQAQLESGPACQRQPPVFED
jgi:hypothetical protein